MADDVYSLKQIEGWQSQLQDFAKTPRTRFSKKQAVEALIDDIEAALEAHPYDEVAEKLKGWGLEIAPGSLKQYVNAYRREHSDETNSPSHKRSGKKTKKKAGVNNAAEQSQKTADNASQIDNKNSHAETAMGSAGNRTQRPSNRTPDGFLEMAEDL
jgi:hypothetical protein